MKELSVQNRLDAIFDEIRSHLDENDGKREKILPETRRSVRLSSEAIRCLHRKEVRTAKEKLSEIRDILDQTELLAKNTGLQGLLQTAHQEYAEAKLFYGFLEDRPLASPKELKVPILAYLHSLSDLTGELRRYILDSVRRGVTEEIANRAEQALALMDDIYYQLITLDYPSGLIPGVRRKTDVIRGIIERTRGDLTLAQSRLHFLNEMDKAKDKGQRSGDR